jgi:hypothetical protein
MSLDVAAQVRQALAEGETPAGEAPAQAQMTGRERRPTGSSPVGRRLV